MNWKKTLIICGIILIIGALVTFLIFMTEPGAEREGATKETAMLVEITTAERGDFRPVITTTGSIEPAQDIVLSPRVNGEVMTLSDNFVPGGYVSKGETLLQIDPSDYRNALQQAQSELMQAESELSLEQGRQTVAQKDYQLFDETLTGENKSLVLREPQLKAALSRVQAAEAAVEQARLNLDRTTVKAPFNAHVLNRNVNVGSQVAPGENLARLVGLDKYWAVATVPVARLRYLTFSENASDSASFVKIRDRTAWSEEVWRRGYLHKLVGSLEDQTRMARVIITVPDPLLQKRKQADKPVLMIGAFVDIDIEGKKLNNVLRINRDFIRKDNEVWVMNNGKLNIKKVEVALKDAYYAYITEGITEDDKIVTTNLSTVVEGAGLRVKDQGQGSEKTSPEDTADAQEGYNI